MITRGLKRKRLVGIFLLGFALSCYPILSIFNRPVLLFGFPVLYLYLFATWALIIALIIGVTWADARTKRDGSPDGGEARR